MRQRPIAPILCLALWGVLVVAPWARSRPPSATAHAAPPQALFKDLFVAVQGGQLYPDGKAFPDAVPHAAPEDILAQYHAQHPSSRAALQHFVEAHFTLPSVAGTAPSTPERVSIITHIDGLWSQLTREPTAVTPYSSLLRVPYPYVVPGGRFREMYYWDSYFTLLGLAESGRHDLVTAMVGNFADLIDTYGHVPNGTRTYYLSRSQPPFFFAMVELSAAGQGGATSSAAPFLAQLRREYAFWMEGAAELRPRTAHRRVVSLPDGSILNRYWDDRDTPRDESYYEDTQLARTTGREPRKLYRDIRAAAESGWDFGSRWFADGRTKATIDTTEIIPVDLNSLLFGLESAIAHACERTRDQPCALEFTRRAAKRRAAMERYLWDAKAGAYVDYRWTLGAQVPRISAATLYPLFTGVASPDRASAVANAVTRDLLKDGGIVTTTVNTGHQWDAPNGWPPLQWVGIAGLRQYGNMHLAQVIACRWMLTVNRVYAASGKLVEKYDVVDASRQGGGGEYPLQDGFSWTNGVMRKLIALYPTEAAYTSLEQCPRP